MEFYIKIKININNSDYNKTLWELTMYSDS